MFSITQTSDGFLWFSSPPNQGIYRFDGVQFLPWSVAAKGGSGTTILNVFGDRAGGLWAIGDSEIVHIKNGAVISRFQLEGFEPHTSTFEDADGSVWVVRGKNAVSDAPLCHVTDREVKCFGKSYGMPIAPADALLSDGKGGFWVGGHTALVHWRGGVSQVYPIEGLRTNAGGNGISSLARGPDGSFWVGIEGEGQGRGLGQFKEGAFRPFVTPTFDGSKVGVSDLAFDRDGNLWVGTLGKGLLRIHGNVVEHYGKADGLSGDLVFAVFEDREGIVWAATSHGIDSFRDARIITFSAEDGLGRDAVAGVLATRDGIWVANSGSLDHIEKNGAISSIRTGNGLPGQQVTVLFQDRTGNMWVGVDDGLYLFKDGHFLPLPVANHESLGLVVGITEDIDGNIWAECAGSPRKLVRIRDFQMREQLSSSQVPPGHTLAPDPGGGIWIGTLKGELILFRNGISQRFPLHPKGNPVSRQILARADGSVLAATEDGLVAVRQGKVQRMTTKNGLPCDTVIGFIEGKEERWWLYTGCGVVELSGSEFQKWWANPEAVLQTRVYDVLEGAQPNTPSFNPAAYSSDGRIWFATGVVLQVVDPARLSQKVPPAETYVKSVIVDRKEFSATDNLKLSPHPRDVQIDYTSPTFLIPQRVKFRYRLQSYDRDWHEAGTRRQAFYTDLPPGNYSFRVVACNSDGVWNDRAAMLDFSIAPAYYQTNWFRALCMAAFLALLWAAYQWRLRQLRHQFEITLDVRVNERTRIARELHDTLLQSFHGLLLRFQTVSQLLPGRPVEAKDSLDGAIEQVAEAITEGRDAVQGLRDSTVQNNDLALAISTLGEELATYSTNHRPSFRVAVEGQSRNLHPILRDETYKIAAEALRNAFRHARARQIEVEIRYDNEQFRLRVRDDGSGIDPAVLSRQGSEGHYGLPGMRERATIIGAKLTVWSEVDAGTEVELCLPAVAAYATSRGGSVSSRH
jgi:signal transduction histidine kinase/ligand-binding sensor domain-containing protein